MCQRCQGCGKLADSEGREPWIYWTSLPVHSAAAVIAGIVKPIPCDACNGTGAVMNDEPPTQAKSPRPTIVCLCGSGRFKEAFDRAEFEETLAGKIVLTIGCNTHDVARTADLAKHKPALDELHLRKIDLADEVLILNVGGYIGESTGRELRYATEQRKSVRFLEPVDADRFADLLRRR